MRLTRRSDAEALVRSTGVKCAELQAALSVSSRRLPGMTQRKVLPIAPIPVGGYKRPIELPQLETFPGAALLPTYRAARLQSGLPDVASRSFRRRREVWLPYRPVGYDQPVSLRRTKRLVTSPQPATRVHSQSAQYFNTPLRQPTDRARARGRTPDAERQTPRQCLRPNRSS